MYGVTSKGFRIISCSFTGGAIVSSLGSTSKEATVDEGNWTTIKIYEYLYNCEQDYDTHPLKSVILDKRRKETQEKEDIALQGEEEESEDNYLRMQ